MGRRALMLVGLAGCGRIGFDATNDAFVGDADLATGPFSAPTLVPALQSPGDDEEPSFTADRLELIYRSTGTVSDTDLYVSRRASVSDPWGPPTPITELNTTSDETNPALAPDGLTLWFTSSRLPSQGGDDLWVTSRPDRTSVWTPPVSLDSLNTVDHETAPRVDVTGIWFNRRDATDQQIWHATGTSPTSWTSPQLVSELNSVGEESTARTWAGGLRIVFNTTRTDLLTHDLWQASRSSLAAPFGNIAPITELNTPGVEDWDMWISDDGHYALFGSDRSGNHEIYEVFR